MQSILRLSGFVFFGGCGIAAAIWFAIASEPVQGESLADRLGVEERASREPVARGAVQISPERVLAPAPTFPAAGVAAGAGATQVGVNRVAQVDADAAQHQAVPQIAVPSPLVAQQVKADEPAGEEKVSLDGLGKAFLQVLGEQYQEAAMREAAAATNGSQDAATIRSPIPPPVEPGFHSPGESDLSVTSAEDGPQASLTADGRFQLNTKPDADLREVLELLSQKSGLNILASKSVQGTVSASLNNVDTQTALDAILKSTGYVAYREGEIIFVGTAEEYRDRKNHMQGIETRIYRPNYVTAVELQQLITPLLTADIGAISISSAAEAGIQSSSSAAGGNDFAGNEVVLVKDYENVLEHVDRVFHEVDRQPAQVAIEAMILSVSLTDESDIGVDFELLKNQLDFRLISGSPPASLTSIVADGGLKLGFLDSSTTLFVEALETIGDTNVIATPRLLVLNKQRAEILIGSELGYVSTTVTETAVTQAVEFLEVGTQLRIRPFIASDGMIRMEVHPELSTGSVRVESGFTLPDKEVTEVTTNIMARDGSTVVIGGLMREDIDNTVTQIPFLGSLPVVGPLFRQTSEETEKREIIVLITPRIVCDPNLNHEGHKGATEFHHRQAIVAEKMSWSSRLAMSRRQLYMAREAWARGNQEKAMRHVNRALHVYPQSREAIELRADILNGVPFGDHTGQGPYLLPRPEDHPVDGHDVAPWLLDDLEAAPPESGESIPPGETHLPAGQYQSPAGQYQPPAGHSQPYVEPIPAN